MSATKTSDVLVLAADGSIDIREIEAIVKQELDMLRLALEAVEPGHSNIRHGSPGVVIPALRDDERF